MNSIPSKAVVLYALVLETPFAFMINVSRIKKKRVHSEPQLAFMFFLWIVSVKREGEKKPSADSFFSASRLLNVLEVVAPFKHFNKLREFVQMKLPPGFPVKLGTCRLTSECLRGWLSCRWRITT